MKTQQEKIIEKFEDISLKYHKLSLLFNELGKSINLELKKKNVNPNSRKQIKEYIVSLNIDFDKIESFSKTEIRSLLK